MSHNFDFLIKEFPDFEFFLTKAENCYNEDPHNCIIKICIVTECILRNICAVTGIKLSDKSGFTLICDKLQKKKIIQKDDYFLLSNLAILRETRNFAAHNIINSEETALKILNAFYAFSSWFYQKFVDNRFIPINTFLYEDTTTKQLMKVNCLEIEETKQKHSLGYNNINKKINYCTIVGLAQDAILSPLRLINISLIGSMIASSLGKLVVAGFFTYKTFKTNKKILDDMVKINQKLQQENLYSN